MSFVHELVRIAVEGGHLPRPLFCSDCGKCRRVVAHHDDYARPLEIRWLCRPCHRAWHESNGPGLNHYRSDMMPTRATLKVKSVVPKRPEEPAADARYGRMVDLAASGKTLRGIAAEYGISHERVRQIIGSPRRFRCSQTHAPQIKPKSSTHSKGCKCESCHAVKAERQRKRSKSLRDRGLCVRCKGQSTSWLCTECGNKDRQRRNPSGLKKRVPVGRSGIRGVCYHATSGKWRVVRYISGKQVYYGAYSDIELAEQRAITVFNQPKK